MAEVRARAVWSWYSGSSLPDHAVGPLEHAVTILLGHAEELGDHLERELGRDLRDEVGLPVLDHLVDDGVGGAVDALLEVAHHARREPLVDEAPVPGVQGRVHVEHHQALLRDLVGVHLEGHGPLGGRAEALVVPVDGDAVLVAGDGPEPGATGLVLPVHGVVAAEVGQIGVRDAGHIGPGIREVDRFDICQSAHGLTTPLINRTHCPIHRMVRPLSSEVNACSAATP